MDHPIFHSPNEVSLTLEDQPTPSSYANYPEGRSLAENMPMWRVQTEGYLDGEGQLVGIVSRDKGFFDSPDVEWISGGVNSKGPNAVAIGRHGNFFHWGFAASPKYLTEEAKLVFVNALHHIAKFDRQAPVARKVQGTMVRESLGGLIADLSDEGYARTEARYVKIRAEDAVRKTEIQAKIDAGEEVSEGEKRILGYPAPETPGRFQYIERFFGSELVERLEQDPDKVAAFIRDHMGYLRPKGWYEIEIDEELEGLGIANNDPRLLEVAIEMLGSQEEADLARTLLERYTNEAFASAAEWGTWLEQNSAQLFFSDSAGYKWLVNKSSARPLEAGAKRPDLKPTEKNPLDSDLVLEDLGDGQHKLTVHVSVLEGWHAYGTTPATSPYVAMKVEANLPPGVTLDGEWTQPAGRPDLESPGLTLLEGDVHYSCKLNVAPEAAADAQVSCVLSYQVCDKNMCLPPQTDTLTTPLSD